MESSNRTKPAIYLFTGIYPYTLNVENFLEDEITYLAQEFEKIYVIPTRTAGIVREMPLNCFLCESVFPKHIIFLLKGLYNCRAFKLIWKDFFNNKVYLSKKKFMVWVKGALVLNNLLNSAVIKNIEKNLKQIDICYYYWGKWSNLLSIFWEDKCKHVSRFHGAWDLWEEDYDNYAPFRESLIKALDKIVPISQKGENYLRNKYQCNHTIVSRLGSADGGYNVSKLDKSALHIVSCSSVYPLKRVPLILDSVIMLQQLLPNAKIKWTHLGGGVDFEKLKKKVEDIRCSSVDIQLTGSISHSEVMELLKNNLYSVFVNVSTNEGIPVSIMEAISFNIPIVATNVGCTSEIVTPETGILLNANPTSKDIANAIIGVVNKNLSPRQFWNDNYNSRINYKSFVELLKSL